MECSQLPIQHRPKLLCSSGVIPSLSDDQLKSIHLIYRELPRVWLAESDILNHPYIYVIWILEESSPTQPPSITEATFKNMVCELHTKDVLLDAWWRVRGRTTEGIVITTVNPSTLVRIPSRSENIPLVGAIQSITTSIPTTSMATRITFIRHQISLSHTRDPGIRTILTSDIVHLEKFDVLVTSPYLRCRETSQQISKLMSINSDVIVDVRLSEYIKHKITGKMHESSLQYGPIPSDNETEEQVVDRIDRAVHDLLLTSSHILVVTHGSIITRLEDRLLKRRIHSRGRLVPYLHGFTYDVPTVVPVAVPSTQAVVPTSVPAVVSPTKRNPFTMPIPAQPPALQCGKFGNLFNTMTKEEAGDITHFGMITRQGNGVTYELAGMEGGHRVMTVHGLITPGQICTQYSMHKFNQSGLQIYRYSPNSDPVLITEAMGRTAKSFYELMFNPDFNQRFSDVIDKIVLSILYMNITLNISHNNLSTHEVYVDDANRVYIPYFDTSGEHPPVNVDTKMMKFDDYSKFIHDFKAVLHDGVRQGIIANGEMVQRNAKYPFELDACYNAARIQFNDHPTSQEVYNQWLATTL